jgi:hypothetical protein
MNTLTDLSDEELRAELARREKQRELAALEVARARFATLLQSREALLELMPHERTSCSDSNPVNGLESAEYGPRCSRCALLELSEVDADYFEFELSLNFVPLNR